MKKPLKHVLGHVPIRKKFIFTIVPCLVLTLFIVILCLLFAWRTQIRPYLHDQAVANINLACSQMQKRIESLIFDSDYMLYNQNSNIQEAMEKLSPDLDQQEYQAYSSVITDALLAFEPFSGRKLHLYKGTVYDSLIKRAFIITQSGEIVLRRSPTHFTTSKYIARLTELLDEPTTQLHGQLYLYFNPDVSNSLIAARKVYKWKSTNSFETVDTQIATFIAEIDMSVFSVLNSTSGVISFAVVNENDHVIYNGSRFELTDITEPEGAQLISGDSRLRVFRRPLGASDFSIIALLDETHMSSDMANSLVMISAAIVITILSIFILLLYVSSTVTEEIRRLNDRLSQTSTLDNQALIPVETEDEIGQLTAVYNDMIGRISALNERVNERELLLKNAELRAFQSQINPHFLYNTLDCINSLIGLGRAKETQKTVTALGNIMRMAIKGSDFLSVEEDLAYIEQYLYIQKMRYQDRILFLIDIPDEVKKCRIPKLILQPVIENAIEHGVSSRIDQGMILIRGRCHDEIIEFSIQDNGIGMPEEILRDFNEDISDHKAAERWNTTRIGLFNIQRRISLIYGHGYGIHIRNLAEGTCVSIRIPRTEEVLHETSDR